MIEAWGDNNHNRYNYRRHEPSAFEQFVENHPWVFIGGVVTIEFSLASLYLYIKNPDRSYLSHCASLVPSFMKRSGMRSWNGLKNLSRWGYRHKYKIGSLCAAGAVIAGGIWVSKQFRCDICMEDKYRLSCTRLSCGHRYCTECLNGQLDYGLRSQSTATLTCPAENCDRRFTNKIVRNIVGYFSPKRTRFQELADREYLNSLPNSQQCPTPDCKYIMEDRGTRAHPVRCPECNQRYCSHCLLSHTRSISCRQAKDQQLSDADKKSARYVNSNSTPCPNCGINIQKNGGCNHMTCRKCRCNFCWLCLAHYKTYDLYRGHRCKPLDLITANLV